MGVEQRLQLHERALESDDAAACEARHRKLALRVLRRAARHAALCDERARVAQHPRELAALVVEVRELGLE